MKANDKFDSHSSAVGLFVTVALVVVVFGGLSAQPSYFPGWLNIAGFVFSFLVASTVIASDLKSHLLSILCGLMAGGALVPFAASIIVS